ncbi:hypothetical protein F511_47260 [Dorcoceras hygrometricum]|uniref:Uncharacterized protein n=1 Tax=Dorcoceras hygrometricum TaxID=472368 RepID=A0A2Z6ZRH8_9LAMI|nr:hypothetical protein F511_47260 [Dorcoceras hygrometricum]
MGFPGQARTKFIRQNRSQQAAGKKRRPSPPSHTVRHTAARWPQHARPGRAKQVHNCAPPCATLVHGGRPARDSACWPARGHARAMAPPHAAAAAAFLPLFLFFRF